MLAMTDIILFIPRITTSDEPVTKIKGEKKKKSIGMFLSSGESFVLKFLWLVSCIRSNNEVKKVTI